MSIIDKLFTRTNQPDVATIARMLSTSPEALAAFETAYASMEDSGKDPDSLFTHNSRQAAAASRAQVTDANIQATIDRIVEELLTLPTDARRMAAITAKEDRSGLVETVTRAELEALGEAAPQLTGTMAAIEIDEPAWPMLFHMLNRALSIKNPQQRTQALLFFQQGLDTMDLDPIIHAALGTNPASMGNWFPQLETAIASSGSSLLLPQTKIATVPLPILQLTRLDFESVNDASKAVVDRWAQQAFNLDPAKSYFIKTGTFSSKFDFRNARVTDPAEVMEIGQYLLYIHHQANQMGSPFTGPRPIVGASTTNEWVVREWIEDTSGSPSIYHGMPLRTEFRVFVDCDSDQVLATAPYWDPEVMKDRFENASDSHTPDMLHDAVVYRAHEPMLMERFHRFKDRVQQQVERLLPHLDLSGQWSLDVMLNDEDGHQLYAIDMAPAANSALSHHVPAGVLAPFEHHWIPQLES